MKLNSIFLSHKKGTENSETIAMPLPARVKISMSQHMGAPCEPTVAKGDRVLVGQVIGESNAFMSCPVHSSVSGTVAAISELLTAGGKVCKMVEIDTDGEQEVSPDVKPPVITDKASLCEAVRQSGCCGMGGAGFPTHIKLNFDENKYKVDTLVINAAECEPYITSDYREMMENADDVMCGIKLVRDMLGLKKVVIGIEDNKPQASTKAYIVQLSVFYLLSFAIAYAHGAISKEECMRLTAELQNVPNMLEVVLKTPDNCQYVASQLVNKENLLYIGRGLDYALSMEGSLKLKEISYIHSESYAAGELKHGTISLVTNNMPVIAVATQRELLDKTISNVKEVKARGAYVVLVTHGYINVDDEVADYKIGLPTIDDLLMPMLTVVPLQLIAYYTSVLRGNDVDKPRNLAKSVTVE